MSSKQYDGSVFLLGVIICGVGFLLMIVAVTKTRDWMLFALGATIVWFGIEGMR